MKKVIVFIFVIFLSGLMLSNYYLIASGSGKTIEEIQAEREKKEREERESARPPRPTIKRKKPITPPPVFDEKEAGEIDLLNVDPDIVAAYAAAVKVENRRDIVKHPEDAINAWSGVLFYTENNPFFDIAEKRTMLWSSYSRDVLQKTEDYIKTKNNLVRILSMPQIKFEQKKNAVVKFLETYGVEFGVGDTLEVLFNSKAKNIAEKILKDDVFKRKGQKIILARCKNGVGEDCYRYSNYISEEDPEKMKYLSISCRFNFDRACKELDVLRERKKEEQARLEQERRMAEKRKIEEQRRKKAEIERKQKEEEKKRLAELERQRIEEEKRKKTEEEKRILKAKFNRELWEAGRKKRVVWGTVSLLSGIGFGINSGIMFSQAKKADDLSNKNYEYYLNASTPDTAIDHRDKVEQYDKMKKIYNIIGGVSIGLGAALITTGIVLYATETKGEKEVRKKYSWSIYTNPFDGTFGVTLLY